jgi:hypothetical protein
VYQKWLKDQDSSRDPSMSYGTQRIGRRLSDKAHSSSLRMFNTNKKIDAWIDIYFLTYFIINYINNKFPKYQEFVDLQ